MTLLTFLTLTVNRLFFFHLTLDFQGLLEEIRSLVPITEDNTQLSLLEEKFKRKEPRVESVENHLWKHAVWIDMLTEGEKSYCAVCSFCIEV